MSEEIIISSWVLTLGLFTIVLWKFIALEKYVEKLENLLSKNIDNVDRLQVNDFLETCFKTDRQRLDLLIDQKIEKMVDEKIEQIVEGKLIKHDQKIRKILQTFIEK